MSTTAECFFRLFHIYIILLKNIFIKKVVEWSTEHDDIIMPLLRGVPRLRLALGPASAREGPECSERFPAL